MLILTILNYMFGLLCLFKKRGDKINSIVATDGSLGSAKPDPKLAKVRANETNMH